MEPTLFPGFGCVVVRVGIYLCDTSIEHFPVSARISLRWCPLGGKGPVVLLPGVSNSGEAQCINLYYIYIYIY